MDATLEARWPQELTDAIIDHLAGDRRTLKACSLVCKAWVPRSQQLIHAEVNISFKHLKTRVDAALPLSVARYVKAIRLHGKAPINKQSTESWDALSHFPNIHRVTFELLCLGDIFSFELLPTLNLPSIFARTTHLIINEVHMQGYDMYHRFLLCFPAVTHLEVAAIVPLIDWGHDMPSLAGPNPTQHPLYDNARAFASSIQSLRINFLSYSSRKPDLHCLLPLFPAGYCSVKRLSIAGWSLERISLVKTLLAAFTETLEDLEIPMHDQEDRDLALDPETLFPMSALGMSV